MKKLYSLWALGLLMWACSPKVAKQTSGTDASSTTSKRKFINPANMNAAAKPGDDFYEYANGAWIKQTPIPASESRWGSFSELRDATQAALKEICEQTAANPGAKGSIEQKVGDFYASGMDSAAIERAGLAPVKPHLDRIAALKDFKGLLAELNALYTEGVSPLFNLYVSLDAKNSQLNVPQLSQGGLHMPDRDYYLKDDERSKTIRKAFETHSVNVFKLLGDDDKKAAAHAADVFRFEKALANAYMSRVERRDPKKLYNKMTVAELEKLSGLMNWTTLFKNTGTTYDYLILDNPKYFQEVNRLLKEEQLEDWKTFLRFVVIKEAMPYLGNAFVMENFKFSQVLTGAKEMQPRWKRISGMTDGTLGEALGRIYVDRNFKPEAKERMKVLVENLVKTYEKRIKNLDWMSEVTKQKALQKLSTFVRKIGYTDKWRDYTPLSIDRSKTFLENITAARRFLTLENRAETGKPVDKTRWGMSPPTVNAYYSPTRNEIVFPAGILQFPFFHFDADDALNYGGIGAVIGHEISHGFDDQGRQFDDQGNLNDWWSPEDAEKFKKKADMVVAQYNACIVLDTVRVNGKLTLGENIADLGGLAVAYDAFKTFSPQGKSNEKIDGFTPDQRFFLSWAQVWRTAIRNEALAQQILTDPHSPGQFRTNIPLTNMQEFYDAFGVKQGDKMWRPESERIKIW